MSSHDKLRQKIEAMLAEINGQQVRDEPDVISSFYTFTRLVEGKDINEWSLKELDYAFHLVDPKYQINFSSTTSDFDRAQTQRVIKRYRDFINVYRPTLESRYELLKLQR